MCVSADKESVLYPALWTSHNDTLSGRGGNICWFFGLTSDRGLPRMAASLVHSIESPVTEDIHFTPEVTQGLLSPFHGHLFVRHGPWRVALSVNERHRMGIFSRDVVNNVVGYLRIGMSRTPVGGR